MFDRSEMRASILDLFDEAAEKGKQKWIDVGSHVAFIARERVRAKRLPVPRFRPVSHPVPLPEYFIVIAGEVDDFIIEGLEVHRDLRKREIEACALCDLIADGKVDALTPHVAELVRIYRESMPGDASGIAAALVAMSIMNEESQQTAPTPPLPCESSPEEDERREVAMNQPPGHLVVRVDRLDANLRKKVMEHGYLDARTIRRWERGEPIKKASRERIREAIEAIAKSGAP